MHNANHPEQGQLGFTSAAAYPAQELLTSVTNMYPENPLISTGPAELIPLTDHDGEAAVLGRDLWEFLEVTTRYDMWFQRMCDYGFEQGTDWVSIKNVHNPSDQGGRPRTEHILTLDMAKELSMIQRTAKGKQARQYFIECEKKLKTAPQLTGTELLARAVLEANTMIEELKSANAELAPKAEVADTFLTAEGDYDVADAAKILNRAGANTGRNRLFQFLWNEGWIYKSPTDDGWRAFQSRITMGHLTEKARTPFYDSWGQYRIPAPQIRITPRGVARLGVIMGLVENVSAFLPARVD